MKWLRRWRKDGYRDLWHYRYGGRQEGDKGMDREYLFLLDTTRMWREAFYRDRARLIEAERRNYPESDVDLPDYMDMDSPFITKEVKP
jgi:hypothetical protein